MDDGGLSRKKVRSIVEVVFEDQAGILVVFEHCEHFEPVGSADSA
jgi:hypothetical protein